MIASTLVFSNAAADDTDGDGVDDGVDDCPLAAGSSTVDRTGCPDRDGDGYSDKNDAWVMSTGGYQQATVQFSGDDFIMVKFSPSGDRYMGAENSGGWGGGSSDLRIHNTSTRVATRTISVSDGAEDIAWSPDGEHVAVLTSDLEVRIYNSTTGALFDTFDVNGEETDELQYSPDGTMIAVTGKRDGNSGDGQVEIFNSMTGAVITTINPGNSVYYYSVDWSPDGNRLAVGGYEKLYIVETNTWMTNLTINTFSSLNAIAWSPDGNMVAACSAWGGSDARERVYNAQTGSQLWSYTTSTSCMDTAWSPDSSQVAFSHSYYRSDGASIHVYNADNGNNIDTLSAPRPGGCTSSGGGNNCGTINGVDWHPDGNHIISAQTRNDEGLYHWIVNPDMDGDGYLNPDDAFPEDGTQWNDTDSDNYGDNPAPANEPDSCPTEFGTSYMDVFGCPDADGDGYSDDGDAFDNDPYQWADADGDGYPSNVNDPRDPNPYGAVDYFDDNPTQWTDSDGDGYGDNFANASWTDPNIRNTNWPGQLIETMTPTQIDAIDTFPLDPEQWNDTDGDWKGDEPYTSNSDGCPLHWGNSIWDRLGCPDSDGDGYSDPGNAGPGEGLASPDGDADAFVNEPTQWWDSDGDGFGDNSSGVEGDHCPGQPGTSRLAIDYWDTENQQYVYKDWYGCEDYDGDGYANSGEVFPNDPTQHSDADGDGYNKNSVTSYCGDNQSGNNPDLFPLDGIQCTDRDGDGYGDAPSGANGDWFPDDPTQWWDSDGDGYGDNPNGTNADMCPFKYGTFTNPEARGCPDTDGDGVADSQDAFPGDILESEDADLDGYGDAYNDSCLGVYGKSSEGGVLGCPDADGDGWADQIDHFENDSSQWLDSDGDGYGDNYTWINVTGYSDPELGYLWGCDIDPDLILTRIENGDAFPNDETQWNDTDGDGHGDNYDYNETRLECWPGEYYPNAKNIDDFPLRASQHNDKDLDGFGDETTLGVFQPDFCPTTTGYSYVDVYGCPDADLDGVSDDADDCKFDPDIQKLNPEQKCEITEDPNTEEQSEDTESSDVMLYVGGGVIIFLLLLIFVALVAKQSGARKRLSEIRDMQLQDAAFAEEEQQRRQQWIDYYLAQGDIDKAKELGYVEKAQWQIHQEQAQADAAALPSIDDLL